MTDWIIAGCRPNFVKAYALQQSDKDIKVLSVGQQSWAKAFAEDLGVRIDAHVDIPAGPHTRDEFMRIAIPAVQAALAQVTPRNLFLIGDTNTTLAAALAARGTPAHTIHVEGGLRGVGNTNVEEDNRRIIDTNSDVNALSVLATDCMLEGPKAIHTGNVLASWPLNVYKPAIKSDGFHPHDPNYALVTLHRAEWEEEALAATLRAICLSAIGHGLQPYVLTHPRWKPSAVEAVQRAGGFVSKPLPFWVNRGFVANAQWVLTDSGGLSEEAFMRMRPLTMVRHQAHERKFLAGPFWGVDNRVSQQGFDMPNLTPQGMDLRDEWLNRQKWDAFSAKRIIDLRR